VVATKETELRDAQERLKSLQDSSKALQ